MQSFTYKQHNSHVVDRKMQSMTLQLRGMVRVVRDNGEAMREHPREVNDLALAAMQLAQMAKRLMEGEG